MDTGASCTMLFSRIYNKLLSPSKLTQCTSNFTGPTGKNILVDGKATVTLLLGEVEIQHDVVVADIQDDCLLGSDILLGRSEGPFNLILSDNILQWNDKSVPCFQVMASGARHVACITDIEVPAHSEMVVDGIVQGPPLNGISVIESAPQFTEKAALLLGNTLVDTTGCRRVKVRVMNPTKISQKVYKNQVVGLASEVQCSLPLFEEESKSDDQDDLHIRVSKEIDGEIIDDTKILSDIESKLPEHVKELYNNSVEGKNTKVKIRLSEILIKHQSTFSKDDYDLGCTHLATHHIDTADAKPIRMPPRRVPLSFVGKDKSAIEKMEKRGAIRPSASPWAAPIVLVWKKNGDARVCSDYRKLNEVTVKDAFPLPRISDCLDAVSGSVFFSTMDLTSGFNQIPVAPEDIHKTAFVTRHGLFECPVMPFGLTNAPATFQRVMELALQGLQWSTCLIYLDDVIVFGHTMEEHLTRLEGVLDRIKEANLKVCPAKCEFLAEEVLFLGHVISGDGIKPSPHNVSKILGWKAPTNQKEVRQFLALASYYRRFIKDFSSIAKPMSELTSVNAEFKWTPECESAFNTLQSALVSPDIMAYPLNDSGEFILDTDACDVGIGAVLSQKQDDVERVISYASRTLNKAERNYCVTDRELLAVKYFVEYFKHYLLGRTFVVRSDHQALKWLFSLKEPKNRIARWIEVLSAFDFVVEYRAGKKHGNADGLSRCPDPRRCQCEDMDEEGHNLRCGPCNKCLKRSENIVENFELPGERVGRVGEQSTWFQGYTYHELKEMQRNDVDLAIVIGFLEAPQLPSNQEVLKQSPAVRHYWIYRQMLSMCNGILVRHYTKHDGTGKYVQFVVPRVMRNDVIYHMHNSLMSGHLGVSKTEGKLLQRFYWYQVREDIRLWILNCDECQSNKLSVKRPRAPLGSMLTGFPMDRLAVDILGPLPVTPRGNNYIMVTTDNFSKWVEVHPLPNQEAETCARVLINEVICRWGCPLDLHSDQGQNFQSEIFKELCRLLEIRKTRTTAFNPKCNGVTERFNRTLIAMIKPYLEGSQENWDLWLGCLAGAYRATPHDSTHMTPNMMMIGREVTLPHEVTVGGSTPDRFEQVQNHGAYVMNVRNQLNLAHDVARKHLGIIYIIYF